MTKPDKYKDRSIITFKHFISFLEIYGQENFGENVEINWPLVYEQCIKFGLLDFNTQLEEVIFSESDEEFRDKCFMWIENQIYEGYPIWRLFHLNNWLRDKLEKELINRCEKEEMDFFNNHKCLKCKYYVDSVSFIGMDKFSHVYNKKNIELYNNGLKPENILHRVNCLYRQKLINDVSKSKTTLSRRSRFHPTPIEFTYKPFNHDDEDRMRWTLDVKECIDCPYFEIGEIDTYEKFIETYGEIYR